jgi:excisionase family DNA binding protein
MKMYTIKDVAEQLRISTKTVYRLINEGKLVPIKIRRNTRIDEAVLNTYLASIKGGLR